MVTAVEYGFLNVKYIKIKGTNIVGMSARVKGKGLGLRIWTEPPPWIRIRNKLVTALEYGFLNVKYIKIKRH